MREGKGGKRKKLKKEQKEEEEEREEEEVRYRDRKLCGEKKGERGRKGKR